MIVGQSPPLVEYAPELLLDQQLPKEGLLCGKSCTQIVGATVSFAVFSTVIVTLATDAWHARSNLVSRSLLSLVGGASVGWFFPSVLSPKKGDLFKSIFSDYATPLFLILSQVYLNLPKEAQTLSQPGFFGFFNAQGGVVLATYIHSVFNWQLGRGVDHPLGGTIQEGEPPSKLKMCVDSYTKRICFSGAIAAAGVASIAVGALVSEAKLFRDFGVILSGSGTARILSEMWWMFANHKFKTSRDNYEPIGGETQYSCMVRSYSTTNRVILVAFHALPGALIVAAEVAAQKNLSPLSMTVFAITGIVIGWNEHLRQARFSEVPIEDLHEVRVNHERIFPPKNFFGGVKWFIGVPCLLTFLGLTLAGYDPDNNTFQKIDPYVVSSMTTFAIALYASYIFSERTRLAFRKEENRRAINSSYYFTHYSLGIPLVFLYVMEKLLINDEGLDLDGPYAGVVTTFAWGSLGLALGMEASSRSDYPHPHVGSSLYFALFGRYFINLLTGKV